MKFDEMGLMLDLSRGKVLNVETIKKMVKNAKSFGYTYINLYIEDLITLEDYPQFGYLRGKYSDKEITEIVEFCKEIEIDIYPAIQTLGHFEHFLRWEESEKLRDTGQVLNVLNDETKKFLAALISKCSHLFPSRKINIGMDEAFDLGQGTVLRGGNKLSQKDLYTNHLNFVVDLCKENGYETIKIWSDMLFNIYSQAGGDGLYSMDKNLEIDKLKSDVEIIFWNYWTREVNQYEDTLDMHYKFSDNVSMALGIHTWGLPFYNSEQLDVTKAALKACESKGVKDILFTMWGDDGSIYNLDSAIYGMYITAKTVKQESSYPNEFEQITGLNYVGLEQVSKITSCGINPLRIIWNDPITNIQFKTMTSEQIEYVKQKANQMLISEPIPVEKIYNLYLKCILNDINLYECEKITKDAIEQAKSDLKKLLKVIENLWLNEAKINGLEEIQLRFVSKINRYDFLFENQYNLEIIEIRNEQAKKIGNVAENYNSISKATKFRW